MIRKLLLCTIAISTSVLAAPGDLDTSFDTDGKLTNPIGGGVALLQQPDGKLVVTGTVPSFTNQDVQIVRYHLNGTLDTTFSGDGKASTAIGFDDIPYALIQQPDGKLVAVGYSVDTYYNKRGVMVLRYNSDGNLDGSFGSGGKLVETHNYNEEGIGIIRQSSGKLVVGVTNYSQFLLARYTSNGVLDTTFAGAGRVSTSFDSATASPSMLLEQADGKLVLAGGAAQVTGNSDFALARYTANGELDTTFDGDGKVVTQITTADDGITALVQQPDGKLIAAGSSTVAGQRDQALVRYNTDGSLDTTFGNAGMVITDVVANLADNPSNSLVLQADGKLVFASTSVNGSVQSYSLVRYNSNGTLDTTFGNGGKILTTLSTTSWVKGLIQQQDGKLVAVGSASNGSTKYFGLARYLSGQADTDGDGLVDWLDTDNDSDGILNAADVFPLDATEWLDTDSDGIGNTADPDDDNDGTPDVMDPLPLQAHFNLDGQYRGAVIQDSSHQP